MAALVTFFMLSSAPALQGQMSEAAPASAGAGGESATPTRLLVRVVANDAKVIGHGVGGVRVAVRDAETDELLAEGVQGGGTGNTQAIMGPRERGATVFAHEGTGSFEAVLQLSGPTRVRVDAEGPLGTPHAMQSTSTTLTMLPGVDVVGEGLVLVLHGFTVVFQQPADADLEEGEVPVRVHVSMLCGCPIEPGGLWDADRMTVTAALVREGAVVASTPLSFAGETSIFAGSLAAPEPGNYELRVTAVDAARANIGLVEREVVVGPS
jgi:hypothetical protein